MDQPIRWYQRLLVGVTLDDPPENDDEVRRYWVAIVKTHTIAGQAILGASLGAVATIIAAAAFIWLINVALGGRILNSEFCRQIAPLVIAFLAYLGGTVGGQLAFSNET
jgi:hypothetical protein